MASIINLNRFRKAKLRNEEKRQAAANLAASGHKKSERNAAKDERARRDHELDGKRIE
jgi:hypothetical protein